MFQPFIHVHQKPQPPVQPSTKSPTLHYPTSSQHNTLAPQISPSSNRYHCSSCPPPPDSDSCYHDDDVSYDASHATNPHHCRDTSPRPPPNWPRTTHHDARSSHYGTSHTPSRRWSVCVSSYPSAYRHNRPRQPESLRRSRRRGIRTYRADSPRHLRRRRRQSSLRRSLEFLLQVRVQGTLPLPIRPVSRLGLSRLRLHRLGVDRLGSRDRRIRRARSGRRSHVAAGDRAVGGSRG